MRYLFHKLPNQVLESMTWPFASVSPINGPNRFFLERSFIISTLKKYDLNRKTKLYDFICCFVKGECRKTPQNIRQIYLVYVNLLFVKFKYHLSLITPK